MCIRDSSKSVLAFNKIDSGVYWETLRNSSDFCSSTPILIIVGPGEMKIESQLLLLPVKVNSYKRDLLVFSIIPLVRTLILLTDLLVIGGIGLIPKMCIRDRHEATRTVSILTLRQMHLTEFSVLAKPKSHD